MHRSCRQSVWNEGLQRSICVPQTDRRESLKANVASKTEHLRGCYTTQLGLFISFQQVKYSRHIDGIERDSVTQTQTRLGSSQAP